jgi:hypothetical protein
VPADIGRRGADVTVNLGDICATRYGSASTFEWLES